MDMDPKVPVNGAPTTDVKPMDMSPSLPARSDAPGGGNVTDSETIVTVSEAQQGTSTQSLPGETRVAQNVDKQMIDISSPRSEASHRSRPMDPSGGVQSKTTAGVMGTVPKSRKDGSVGHRGQVLVAGTDFPYEDD